MFEDLNKPEISLITNHGYAGPNVPIGGAADTGGQNLYVNTLALTLSHLGYKVTIFTRGGFPHYKSKSMRDAPEYLSESVRYIYVPGGDNKFMRKEDIAVALDEELEWLYEFVNQEAKMKGCKPWEVYDFINTHYWDAAILGAGLIERWKNDLIAGVFAQILDGILPTENINRMQNERHWRCLGESPTFHLGWLLLWQKKSKRGRLKEQLGNIVSRFVETKKIDTDRENNLMSSFGKIVSKLDDSLNPTLKRLMISEELGNLVLSSFPDLNKRLTEELSQIDGHVWTPHSLGNLKDYNFRSRPKEIRRKLKFCERRSHEKLVCNKTNIFVATSSIIAEYLWGHYQVSSEQTFYFPPCVNGLVFRPYSEGELLDTYHYLSEISGIPEAQLKKGKIIFETSRMDRTKRKNLLLSAFAGILPDYDNDLFLFIGGGPENEVFKMLEKQIKDTKILQNRAFLTKQIPNKYIGQMFSLADIYATGSEMEGFGMCALQAAASQTAIVSADTVPFCRSFVPESVEMFSAGDVKAFADGLRQLLDDEDKRNNNAKQLKEKSSALSWEYKAKEFLSFLKTKGVLRNKILDIGN